jgi:hypothetical protein
MTTLKNWGMLTMFVLNLSACNAENYETIGNIQKIADSDTTNLTTLTITKVKKPWYAWKGLVVGKMRKSIPEYEAVKGLKHKFYSFTDDHKYFGGIYLWKSEQESKNWFNQTWFDRTEKKYGLKGIVLSFQVKSITTITLTEKNKGDFFAVLSYIKTSSIDWNKNSKGLLQVIELRDSNQKGCYLSLWENKKTADIFFNINKSENECFEVPFLLNNTK